MKSKLLLSAALLAQVISSQASAQADLVLPMHYGADAGPSFSALNSRLLRGARASISSGDLALQPTNILYLVPNSSKVTNAIFQVNDAANCSVIKNDLAMEKDASALASDIMESIKADMALVAEYDSEKRQAVRDCLTAKKAKSPDAADICAYKDEIVSTIDGIRRDLAPQQSEVESLIDKIQTRIGKYGEEIGGYMGATMSLFNKAEIEATKTQNPGYEVRLIPMEDITFSLNPAEEGYALEAGRRTTFGFHLQGEPMGLALPEGSPAAASKVKTGESTSVGVLLTRLGACQSYHGRTGTWNYNYAGFGAVQGKATYNYWAYYTHLEEKKTKGGFFNTKTVHQISDDLQKKDVFKVAAAGDLDDLEKAVMEEKLRTRLEARMLKLMATTVSGDASLTEPGASGASVASDALLKCPNEYCQAGGYVLKTLDAIFGSKVSRAEVQQKWDYTVSEDWSYTTRHVFPGSAETVIEWKN